MSTWMEFSPKLLNIKQAGGMIPPAFFLLAILSVAALGRKLGLRERNAAEHFAGIFGTAGVVAAFFGGNAVIQHRHHQLGIPLQAQDGELSQGYQ